MKVKRLLPLLLIAALLLVGCGGDGGENKTKVGVLFADYTHSASQKALLSALEDAGYQPVTQGAEQALDKQLSQLNQLVEQEVPLVIVEPADPEKADQLAAILNEASVSGLFIGEEPADEVLDSGETLYYIGMDETRQGYTQGQMLQSSMDGGDINGDGLVSYAVIRGVKGDSEADLTTQYCCEAMEKGRMESRLLEICVSDGSKDSGREEARKLLNKFGKDVEVLFCNADALALGAVQAVLSGGWTPGEDVYILGVGGTEEMLGLIKEGTCAGTVIPDESVREQQIAETVKALLEGAQVQKRSYAGYLPVTGENVAIFYDGE